MSKFGISLLLVILLLVIGGLVFMVRNYDTLLSPSPAASAIPTATPENRIQVDSPQPGDPIASPLQISGQARGAWYFEASFPVKLLDANEQTVASGIATAQGEWMTEDFVPFTASLTFTAPVTPIGWLILQKDNPSGLPEHDAAVRIPVVFSQ